MFQSSVGNNLGAGVVGELYLEGPLRAQPGLLASAAAANNVIGRAFTIVNPGTGSFETANDPTAPDVGAGGTGVFAGILANPKVYSNPGTAAGGTLAANTTLPNTTVVELVQQTAGMFVLLPAAFAPGDWVFFNQATGALTSAAPGTATPGGSTRLPGGRVERFASAAAGLAVISFDSNVTS